MGGAFRREDMTSDGPRHGAGKAHMRATSHQSFMDDAAFVVRADAAARRQGLSRADIYRVGARRFVEELERRWDGHIADLKQRLEARLEPKAPEAPQRAS
jgi:hypothetical protein